MEEIHLQRKRLKKRKAFHGKMAEFTKRVIANGKSGYSTKATITPESAYCKQIYKIGNR